MGRRAKYPHMVRQGQTWHARLDIPADAREILGKRVFARSTRLSDADEAYRLAQPWIEAWKRDIALTRKVGEIEGAKTLSAKFLASSGIEADYLLLSDVSRFIARRQHGLSEIEWRNRVADHAYDVSAAVKSIGSDASKTLKAMTSIRTPFYDAEKLAAFKAEDKAGLGTKTMYEYTRTIERFSAAIPGLFAEEINVQHCQDFIRRRTTDDGVSVRTLKKDFAGLKTYWKWLVSRDVSLRVVKPFDDIEWPTLRRIKIDPSSPDFHMDPDLRGPRISPEEVCDLWDAADLLDDKDLRDLIILCAYTGGRREGVFTLHKNAIDVKGKIPYLTLNEKKSAAGLRTLPIHPDIMGLVKSRIKRSEDGYLFRGGVNAIGSRSSRMQGPMRKLFTKEGHGKGFGSHAFRRTFAAMLEVANVNETHAAKLIGHTVSTLTYGLYSGALPLVLKQQYMLAAIRFPRSPPVGES